MSSELILRSAYRALEKEVVEFQEALDGIPDDDLAQWKPAAEQNGGGDMNTFSAMGVHVAEAATWRIVHQVFGREYPRDRESEFFATETRAQIDARLAAMMQQFAELMAADPDVDLDAMPPTIREKTPNDTKLDYLVGVVYHTGLHLGHAQITKQLWLAERANGNDYPNPQMRHVS